MPADKMAAAVGDGPVNASYDRTPHKSNPFRQSHPDRLAVIGTLLGMSPPRVENASILELGCASGGNLLPMAQQFPEAKFLGIDNSSRQILDGQTTIAAAGLKNVELRHADILEFECQQGTYDYIICHGVYSWVPDNVQKKILEICGRCLSQQGIAYVSYNTYPGWHMRGMIRDIMRYRAKAFEQPEQQLLQARGLLTFLSESVRTENNAFGILLKNELETISGADDSYLLHDHLEEINDPTYFHEFASRASENGLQYLGEAEFGTMSVENFPERVRGMLRSVSQDIIETEQYMDFLRNRMFRQTLLCRADINVKRGEHPEALIKLHIASNSHPDPQGAEAADEERTTYHRGASVLTTTDPTLKAAMKLLRDAWPASVPFLELAAVSRSLVGSRISAVQVDAMSPPTWKLAEALLRCFSTGQVDLHATTPRFTTRIADCPAVSALARVQAVHGGQVTDSKHQMVTLDDFQRQLLPLLDGTHNHAMLVDAMTRKILSGELLLHRQGRPVTDEAGVRTMVEQAMIPILESLAKAALLS